MKSEGRRTHQGGPSYLDYRGWRSKSEQKGKDKGSPKGPIDRTHEERSPSQHLWVGSISSAVTETMLAEQFSRFGDIESLKLYPSKNYAFVSLKTVEDALYAKKRLHGAVLGGMVIRVEFAKGDSRRFDQSNLHKKSDHPEETIKARETSSHDKQEAASAHLGNNEPSEKLKGNESGEPSEVLWIGFPLHLRVDERKLHELFAPFGGVEKVTTFPGRTYAFVRFQSVRAAARAKDALQGKLFNDPRVSISFTKSDIGPIDPFPVTSNVIPIPPLNPWPEPTPSFPPRERATDLNMLPSSSSPVMDLQANIYPSACPPRDDGLFPPMFSASKYESASSPRDHRLRHADMRGWMDAYREGPHLGHGKKLSENEVGFLANGSQDFGQRENIVFNEPRAKEEESDGNKREQKRQRFENEPVDTWGKLDSSLTRLVDHESYRGKTYPEFPEHNYEHAIKEKSMPFPSRNKGFPGLFTSVETMAATSETLEDWRRPQEGLLQHMVPSEPKTTDRPVDLGNTKVQVGGSSKVPTAKSMFRWEGIIAKGGTHICHCRCLPASKEISVTFPDILNCTARTSLDMLASYISHVSDFSLVLFMPRGGADVAPYQELMAFLAEKKRAAVCRLPEERTLFLVPPTDFIDKFLKVPKSNNILGVVLGQEQLQIQVLQDTTTMDSKQMDGGCEKGGVHVSASIAMAKANSQTSHQNPFQPPHSRSSMVDFPTGAGTRNPSAGRSNEALDRYAIMDNDTRGYETRERSSLVDFQCQESTVQMESRRNASLSEQDCTTFPERPTLPQFPWPPPPPSLIPSPQASILLGAAHRQRSFLQDSNSSENSHQRLLSLDCGGQGGGEGQLSSRGSRSFVPSHPRNMQPPQLVDGGQVSGQQPGHHASSLPQSWEKSDQHEVRLQRSYTSDEDQKKFQATLELAAVLLQQLQQQSKR